MPKIEGEFLPPDDRGAPSPGCWIPAEEPEVEVARLRAELREVAAGGDADVEKVGGRPVGYTITRDVTDITEEEAKDDLADLLERKKEKR